MPRDSKTKLYVTPPPSDKTTRALRLPNSPKTEKYVSLSESFSKKSVIVGAKVLYLPPYSPDYNPIEMVFSKLKQLVRKFKLRKMDELRHKLGELCDVFSLQECQNYFKHAGYGKNAQFQTNS